MNAATADALVPGAAPRALIAGEPHFSPYSQGRNAWVVVALAPSALTVPTELESIRFTVAVGAGGALTVTARPSRNDLATAVAGALESETRAVATAASALAESVGAPPPDRHSWPEALKRIAYDSRSQAEPYDGVGTSWSLIFEPWTEGHGWNGVLLDGKGARATHVNGKPR